MVTRIGLTSRCASGLFTINCFRIFAIDVAFVVMFRFSLWSSNLLHDLH
jgi:hypothetical protein